jgi:glycosyltransferase involved in cell wall biosynthesis
VAALTPGRNVPSARFRVRALIPCLRERGVIVREFIPSVDAYPPESKWQRPAWGVAALASRLPAVAATYRHDVTLLQRQLLSTLCTLEPATHAPRVLDVDDAIFLRRASKGVRRVVHSCELIICGNQYLADWFSRYHANIRVVPTAVDTHRFRPHQSASGEHRKDGAVIGWIGTSSNLSYLHSIEPALAGILAGRPRARLRIVSDKRPRFHEIAEDRVEFRPWSADREVEDIQSMDIGIMPLSDGPWERGKCAFKLLQYLACGVPVVASPVGVNAEILATANVGMAASGNSEWEDALTALVDDADLRLQLGEAGRRLTTKHYDVAPVADQVNNALRSAL